MNENKKWALYILELPVVRHNGEIRQCKTNSNIKAINPEEIYNDETLTLTYGHYLEAAAIRNKVN